MSQRRPPTSLFLHCSQLVPSAKSQGHQGNLMMSIDGRNFMDYMMLKVLQHNMMLSVTGIFVILNNLLEECTVALFLV